MNLGIRDNIALITGAGRGIGASCASLFSDEGAKLVLVDKQFEDHHSESDFQQTEVDYFTLDVTSEDDIKSLFETVTDKYGRIDYLINSAGIYREKPLVELEISDWNKMLDEDSQGIDAVVLATPEWVRVNVIKDIIKFNKHILLEKPLAVNMQDADMIRNMILTYSKKFMVCHPLRY